MPSASLPVNAPSFLSTAPAADNSALAAGAANGSGNSNGNSFQDMVNSAVTQNQDAPAQTNTTTNTPSSSAPTTRSTNKHQESADTTAAANSAASYVAVQSVVDVQYTLSDSSGTTTTETTISTTTIDAGNSTTLNDLIANQFKQMEQLLSALSQSLGSSTPVQSSSAISSSHVSEFSAIQDLAATLQQLEQGLTQSASSQFVNSQSEGLPSVSSQAGAVQNNGSSLTNDQINALLQRIEADVNQLASLLPLSNKDASNTDTSATSTTSSDQVLKQLLAQAASQNTPDTTATSISDSTIRSTSTSAPVTAPASPATLLTELQSVFTTLAKQLQTATAATTTTTDLNTNAPIQLATSQSSSVASAPVSTSNVAIAAPAPALTSSPTTSSVPATVTSTAPAPTINAGAINAAQLPLSLPITTDSLNIASTSQTSAAKEKDLGASSSIVNDAPVISASALLEIVHGGSKNTNSSNDNNQGQPSQAPISFISATATNGAAIDNSSSFSSALANVSTSAILEQVAVQIKSLHTDGSSNISIQLHPAELGKLEIKLNVGTDGKTNVTVTADNNTTLNLLRQDSQGLARALSDAGLSTTSGSLNFNLRGGQHQNGTGSQGNSPYKIAQIDTDDELPPQTSTQTYVVNLTKSLDIQI